MKKKKHTLKDMKAARTGMPCLRCQDEHNKKSTARFHVVRNYSLQMNKERTSCPKNEARLRVCFFVVRQKSRVSDKFLLY